tara:strand:- start:321 stop:1568 length:1248 start_codon:yes stop_codon:yes gene_type:complete
LNKLQKLHPKEIDLSLNRISNLLKKLDEPQNKIKAISVVGTNGKYSTIQACFSILKEANFKCNIYTSPHILKINERFVFNNEQLKDDELSDLLRYIEKVNNNEPITFFEILTASFLYKSSKYQNNINLIEAGLFHRFDATNVFKKNLASIVTSISKDHLDWIPEDERTIEKIVFEKTSALLKSNIIVAKQSDENTMNCIKKTIFKNHSNKLFFGENYSYLINDNNFFEYKDKFGKLKLPLPNILGEFQLENISNAIATLRSLDIGVNDDHILKGIKKINNLGRLQKIETGKLKNLIKNNTLIVDGSHNENGSQVLNKYLETLNCRKHLVIGMMANKQHEKYISYFKNISSVTTIDIPNQPNSISGKELKNKFKSFTNVQYQPSIIDAIKSVDLKKGDLLLITGSLYLAGAVLNLN